MTTILFLGANPIGQRKLSIGAEAELIREELARAGRADEVRIEHRMAVTPEEMKRALKRVRPQYVHISSHGAHGDLIFRDDAGQQQTLLKAVAARMLNRITGLRGVLLMACESLPLAQALDGPFAVGMAEPISDRAALAYAKGFYIGLAAGDPPDVCHEDGIDLVMNLGVGEDATPRFEAGTEAAPEPVPAAATGPRLTTAEVERVVNIALRYRRDRSLLLRGLPDLVVGNLPRKQTPLAQLQSDVLRLNDTPTPAGQPRPLVATWLRNLATDIDIFPEATEVKGLLPRFDSMH